MIICRGGMLLLCLLFGKVFSGSCHEQEYTENSMNDFSNKKEIRNAFEEDQYKILIVANKFQTGFDQPLLHTMYVDKMLNGITASNSASLKLDAPVFKNRSLGLFSFDMSFILIQLY